MCTIEIFLLFLKLVPAHACTCISRCVVFRSVNFLGVVGNEAATIGVANAPTVARRVRVCIHIRVCVGVGLAAIQLRHGLCVVGVEHCNCNRGAVSSRIMLALLAASLFGL